MPAVSLKWARDAADLLEEAFEIEAPAAVVAAPMDFREFICKVNPRLKWSEMSERLVALLQRVADGELKRLMVFMPPRHGKSELVSRLFSAYYLYRWPDRYVGLNSYAAELAYTFSRAARANFRDGGGEISEESWAVKHWETRGGGGMWASGVGGPITGKGFSCFPEGVSVTTEWGKIDIATLCQLQDPPRVLSFNHESNTLEWKRIVAVRVKPARDFVEISLPSGGKLRCTPDHPIFSTESGYRASGDLVPGETVIQVAQIQKMRGLPRANSQTCFVRELLSRDSRLSLSSEMYFLQRGIRETALRSGESLAPGQYGVLLRRGMFTPASRHEAPPDVQSLRQSRDRDANKLLLPKLHPRSCGGVSAITGQGLRNLQHGIQPKIVQGSLLLQGLSEQSTFNPHGWQGQQPLQDRYKLCTVVQGDESRDQGKGSIPMRRLREAREDDSIQTNAERWNFPDPIEPSNSPYRLQSQKQQSRELGDSMQRVPQAASPFDRCWQVVPISGVDHVRGNFELVYDLQVEGNHNFFANEILVHNCGIIDDPLKNHEEASSEAVRKGHKDWYDSTFYTRAEEDAAIVVLQTRWHEDDLSGWLLSREEESPENWHIVSLEAIKGEIAPSFPPTCTVEPDWRRVGEPLNPVRMSLARLQKISQTIRNYFWLALYQQRPRPADGDMFKESWFQRYDRVPSEFEQIAVSVDCNFKSTKSGSFVVIQLWGMIGPNFYLIHQMRDRMGFVETRAKIRDMVDWSGELLGVRPHAVLVEDKANGPAIMDELRSEIAGLIPINPGKSSKEARAEAVSSYYEGGNVWLPEQPIAPFIVKDYLDEFLAFPNAATDDQVDASSQLISWVIGRRRHQVHRPPIVRRRY
jgi:predicted phage terminase large subunit-like protein